MILMAALFSCPLVGFEEVSTVAHRVEAGGLPVETWETATHCTAVCGAAVKLVECRWVDLRTRGTQITRCRECNRAARDGSTQ